MPTVIPVQGKRQLAAIAALSDFTARLGISPDSFRGERLGCIGGGQVADCEAESPGRSRWNANHSAYYSSEVAAIP